jgi:hypothetical protein
VHFFFNRFSTSTSSLHTCRPRKRASETGFEAVLKLGPGWLYLVLHVDSGHIG